jgi:DNA (cytosine-5)-methyltransferase 1
MKFGSLFSGIGGLDLGLERAGMECAWQVENDPFCQTVLAHHWPDVPGFNDVHEVGKENLDTVDLIAGGFPCQPVSQAGRRKGQNDERWLWPEFARIVGELRPRWVLAENVPALASKGLADVLADLATLGYDAEWELVSAASVGAPHLRERIFIVAYPNSERPTERGVHEGEGEQGVPDLAGSGGLGAGSSGQGNLGEHSRLSGPARGDVEDADGRTVESRRRGRGAPEASERATAEDVADAEELAKRAGLREDEPTALRWRRPGDGGSPGGYWTPEPDVGRVAHGVPNRLDRLRALGNGVVPQVAEYVGYLIMEAEANQ